MTQAYETIQRKLGDDDCVTLDGPMGTELKLLCGNDFELSDSN